MASGAFVIGAVISRLTGGKYLDVVGRRRTLIAALAASILLPLLYGIADPLWALVIVRAFHGAAFGVGSTAISTGAIALLPVRQRGEGAGYYGLSTVIGTAVGPMTGVALINGVGYEALFISSAVCASCGLAIALFLRLPERDLTEAERKDAHSWRLSALIDFRALRISLIIFMAGLSFSTILAFLNNYSRSQGQGEAAGVFFLVYAVSALMARLFVGRLQDRFGNTPVILPLLIALSAGLGGACRWARIS